MTDDAKFYGVVEALGNEGETQGLLSVVAIVGPSPNYPDERIMVGSPTTSDVDCGQFAMSCGQAVALIAKLSLAIVDIAKACPTAVGGAIVDQERTAPKYKPSEEEAAAVAAVSKAMSADASGW
jgi:hypothetical protein